MVPNKTKVRTKTQYRPDYKKFKLEKKKAAAQQMLALEDQILAEAPPSAAELIANPALNYVPKQSFHELPISEATLKSLDRSKFTKPRNVQQLAVPHALARRNCVINARTGSGKTLAFSIPIIENLFRANFTPEQGLGAIVIVPTKELAVQVYEVINKLGANHDLSLAVIFGGKSREEEAKYLHGINILVATPGRLLEHLDRTAELDVGNLQMLVIDEADRILDMGFSETLNNILQTIPSERQTLLCSATPIVFDHLDISSVFNTPPEFVDLYNGQSNLTPSTLKQYYTVIKPELKLSYLYSFLKQHKNQRTIVFVSTCRQVKYIQEVLTRSNLSIPISYLTGKMNMQGRLARHKAFDEWNNGVMICTDVASRGLDFAKIDWVIQLDCPENINSYVHRVGRTARSSKGGNALLVLCPFELKFLHELNINKVTVTQVQVKDGKVASIDSFVSKVASLSEQNEGWAIKAMTHYVKSLYMIHNKDIALISQIDLAALARSYGLNKTPQMEVNEQSEKLRRLEQAKLRNRQNLLNASSTSFITEKDIPAENAELKLKDSLKEFRYDDASTEDIVDTDSQISLADTISENSETEAINRKLLRLKDEIDEESSDEEPEAKQRR